uniref:Putative secreted protein n=1 Tax=Corethrella appendiculata TaxID=1370023 RepID=U5EP05_9DIPT
MKLRNILLFSTFILSLICNTNGKVLSVVLNILKAKPTFKSVSTTIGVSLVASNAVNLYNTFTSNREKFEDVDIIKSMALERFDNLVQTIEQNGALAVDEISKVISVYSNLAPILNRIEKLVSFVRVTERKMHTFKQQAKLLEKRTLINFSKALVSLRRNSISIQMKTIFRILSITSFKIKRQIFFDQLVELIKQEHGFSECGVAQFHIIMEFFRIIYSAEVVVYTLQVFAYSILKLYRVGSFYDELSITTNQLIDRLEEDDKIMKKFIAKLDSRYYLCEEDRHEKGTTYEEMNRLVIGSIEPLENLSNGFCQGKKCGTTYQRNVIRKRHHPNIPDCQGKLHRCRHHGTYEYCVNRNESDSRFYKYLQGSWTLKHGNKDNCETAELKSVTTKGSYCEVCFCECASESQHAHIHLSLRPEISDIHNNRVVVSVRFRKIGNRVMGLQIKEGTLLEDGIVSNEGLRWKEQTPFEVDERTKLLKESSNLHKLTYDNNKMIMKSLSAPTGTVVTGVKFIRVKDNIVDLSIHYTSYNKTTGKLDTTEAGSIWFNKFQIPSRKHTFDPFDKQLPTTCTIGSYYFFTNSGDQVKFSNSNLINDGGQSTLPFFDTRDVVPKTFNNVILPLSGIGIQLRGCTLSGGFITPLVYLNKEGFM